MTLSELLILGISVENTAYLCKVESIAARHCVFSILFYSILFYSIPDHSTFPLCLYSDLQIDLRDEAPERKASVTSHLTSRDPHKGSKGPPVFIPTTQVARHGGMHAKLKL